MNQLRLSVIAVVMLACIGQARGANVTLGEQDFLNGTFPSFTPYGNASTGEPVPFNGFRGTDLSTGDPFTGTFTFNYSPDVVTSGSITLGLYDHDSAATGSQVQSFLVDGNDLTALLDSALNASGGTQVEYNVYTIPIPAGALPAFTDGSATFSLTLQAPGLEGVDGTSDLTTQGNGAGLDFATLNLVPEPSGFMTICMGAALVLRRRASRRTMYT